MGKGQNDIITFLSFSTIGLISLSIILGILWSFIQGGGFTADQSTQAEFSDFVEQVESACESVEQNEAVTVSGSVSIPSNQELEISSGAGSVTMGDNSHDISCSVANSYTYSGTVGYSISTTDGEVSFR